MTTSNFLLVYYYTETIHIILTAPPTGTAAHVRQYTTAIGQSSITYSCTHTHAHTHRPDDKKKGGDSESSDEEDSEKKKLKDQLSGKEPTQPIHNVSMEKLQCTCMLHVVPELPAHLTPFTYMYYKLGTRYSQLTALSRDEARPTHSILGVKAMALIWFILIKAHSSLSSVRWVY